MTSASSRQLAYLAFRRKGLISRTLNWVLQAWKDTLSKPQNERVVVRRCCQKESVKCFSSTGSTFFFFSSNAS